MARILLFVCVFVCGCQEHTIPRGVVAEVNGEYIFLSAVQSLLDCRSASSELLPRPTVADLRENYRGALITLIAHTLVRQELAERGLGIEERSLDEAIAAIKSEYGAENFEALLVESSLREDEWRQLMRDHLALEIFINRILLPAVKIPLADVRAYYELHEEQFGLPAYGHVCFVEEADRAGAEAWCSRIAENAVAPGPFAQCTDLTLKELPEPWGKTLPEPGKCGKIIEQDGKWRTVALISRMPAARPLLSEVYGLIENILLAEKRQAAFEEWFTRKLAASRVRVTSDLFPGRAESEF